MIVINSYTFPLWTGKQGVRSIFLSIGCTKRCISMFSILLAEVEHHGSNPVAEEILLQKFVCFMVKTAFVDYTEKDKLLYEKNMHNSTRFSRIFGRHTRSYYPTDSEVYFQFSCKLRFRSIETITFQKCAEIRTDGITLLLDIVSCGNPALFWTNEKFRRTLVENVNCRL